jgi:hypothetical protein
MKTKYLSSALVIALCAGMSFGSVAQEKKKKSVGETIEKSAKDVGNKTAEVAVKGGAKVVDQTYKGMMAPDGTNVYIDGKNRKYYVNKKGAKIYLKASQIRKRP